MPASCSRTPGNTLINEVTVSDFIELFCALTELTVTLFLIGAVLQAMTSFADAEA